MITIHTNIEWQNSKYDNITGEGLISLSEEEIIVSVKFTSKDMRVFSAAHPARIDIHVDLAKNIIYGNCLLNGNHVDIDCSKAHVRKAWLKGNNLFWTLSELSYTDSSRMYKIINAPYYYLSDLLGGATEISFEDCKCQIEQTENPCYSKLIVTAGTPNDDGLFTALSLYAKCPITPVVETVIENDKQIVQWKPASLPIFKENLENSELYYINVEEANSLTDFLKKCKWNIMSEKEKSDLQRAVYTFATSKYLSSHLQFLTIYTILNKFVGNRHGKPYPIMRENLRTYGINITKIGVERDSEIISWGLKLERDDGNYKEVKNFCDLRDFILHFMTTSQIDDYLDKGVIVGKLRLAAFIILLKELGFEKISFKDEWKHLSILTQPIRKKSVRFKKEE